MVYFRNFFPQLRVFLCVFFLSQCISSLLFLFYFLEGKMILNGSVFLPSDVRDQQLSFFFFFLISRCVQSLVQWYSSLPLFMVLLSVVCVTMVKHCQKTISEYSINKQSNKQFISFKLYICSEQCEEISCDLISTSFIPPRTSKSRCLVQCPHDEYLPSHQSLSNHLSWLSHSLLWNYSGCVQVNLILPHNDPKAQD